jgi:hypothetical protein
MGFISNNWLNIFENFFERLKAVVGTTRAPHSKKIWIGGPAKKIGSDRWTLQKNWIESVFRKKSFKVHVEVEKSYLSSKLM